MNKAKMAILAGLSIALVGCGGKNVDEYIGKTFTADLSPERLKMENYLVTERKKDRYSGGYDVTFNENSMTAGGRTVEGIWSDSENGGFKLTNEEDSSKSFNFYVDESDKLCMKIEKRGKIGIICYK